MRILFFIFAYFVILASVIPFIPSSYWLIKAFEFPRYQLVFIGFIAFILLMFIYFKGDTHSSIVAILLFIATGYQLARIYPYTFLAKKQVLESKNFTEETSLSLMIANVYMDNTNSKKFLEIVNQTNPDMILAEETNAWWADQLDVLKNNYEYTVLVPLENTYGILLYSKLELINPEVKYLVENDVPSIHSLVKLKSGDTVEMHFVHPRPPAPQENEESDERDAELLLVGKKVRNSEYPVIVAGDLNDVAWSSTTRLFQKVSGLLDPRIGRGFYNTFHADYYLMRWPLDYVFHSNHFKLVKLERLPHFDSDHFPVFIKLNLEKEAQKIQEKPVANGEDIEEANEKIQEGKENVIEGK